MRFILFSFLILYCIIARSQDSVGLSADPMLGNRALLFTMTDENGRKRNLDLIESVFKDKSLGFDVESYHNVSSPFMYEKLAEVVTGLEDGASLLVYLNSHGGGSGDRFAMTARGGSFKFSKAIESMGRSGRPVRRLVLLVDTCHAEGSIQNSTGEDGELLKNLQMSKPTSFLPELPDSYSRSELPFTSPFVSLVPTDKKHLGKTVMRPILDYGQDSGVYEEMLIISSSSVEDYSVRGVFASRLATTFNKVKEEKSVTLGEFLKMFAQSHGSNGQQPHYKVIPDDSMFSELLFGPWPAQNIPILDRSKGKNFGTNFIPMPKKSK